MVKRLLVVLVACAWLIPLPCHSSETPDELFISVWFLQLELGNDAQANAVRDRFGLRELQSEAARGFLADPALLSEVLQRFRDNEADYPDPRFGSIADLLEKFVRELEAAAAQDVAEGIAQATPQWPAVSIDSLAGSRDALIRDLTGLDEYNQVHLSYFGRHVLNQRLELPLLLSRLQELQMEPAAEPSQRPPFLGRLNALRQYVAGLRNAYSMAATEYVNPYLSRIESELSGFEQRAFAFLRGYVPAEQARFERNLARRLSVLQGAEQAPAERDPRVFEAELGRWVELLTLQGLEPGFRAAARRDFGKPNLHVTVDESVVNEIASRPLFQVDPVDDVVLGSRVQGWSQTSGTVSLDFQEDPYNAHVRVQLAASVVADNYTKQGPVTAYTGAFGSLEANRSAVVNLGGVQINAPQAYASIRSEFRGVNCNRLIERIANRQFQMKQFDAERISSERARQRLLEQFTEQSDEALKDGLQRLDEARTNKDDFLGELNSFRRRFSEVISEDESGTITGEVGVIDAFPIPRLSIATTDRQLRVAGTLDGPNRLAASTDPPGATIPVDVRVQIHETLLSNAVAPLFQGRLYQNWQFARLSEVFVGAIPEGMLADDDKRWSIVFAQGRPIQFEFEDNLLGVSIFGSRFIRDNQTYTDPIKISLKGRFEFDGERLQLVRVGKATVEFSEPGPKSAGAITFRTFLQDNLDEALKADPVDTAIHLPPELLPFDDIPDDELRESLREMLSESTLVECRAEMGWLTLGWNYHAPDQGSFDEVVDTPAIWIVGQ